MPTYDYECTSCGHTFEEFQSMSDEPLSKCPECRKKVRRLIGGGIGVIFKGSGFYVTDNKKSSASSSTDTAVKTEKKKDTKPETGSSNPAKSDKKETKKKDKKSA